MKVTRKNLSRLLILTITFVLLITSSIILLIQNNKTFVTTNVYAKEIEKVNIIEKLQNDYNNKDVVALLNVSNIIEEPVVQTKDNKYYLNHNINNEDDKYGTTYMDYRIDLDKSKKVLIFGHSSQYKETAFGKLERYYDKNFYEKNKYIKLTTSKEERTYKIFSVYIETSDWKYMNLKFNTQDDWFNHLQQLKDKSMYNTNTEIAKDDEIIILQTCSNKEEYKKYKKKYLIVAAKRENKL
ncbi:MAG: class B sortase [Bacilli bacterium]|nr:class B sortase [Bacilli bacterium]